VGGVGWWYIVVVVVVVVVVVLAVVIVVECPAPHYLPLNVIDYFSQGYHVHGSRFHSADPTKGREYPSFEKRIVALLVIAVVIVVVGVVVVVVVVVVMKSFEVGICASYHSDGAIYSPSILLLHLLLLLLFYHKEEMIQEILTFNRSTSAKRKASCSALSRFS